MVDVDASPKRHSPEQRQWEILRALLLGTSPMVIAMDHCVSTSTVTSASSFALKASGATGGLRAVPVVLAAAAHAAAGVAKLGEVVGAHSVADRRVTTFLLPRIEPEVRNRLGAAELKAIEFCLEGQTTAHAAVHADMTSQAISSARARAFRKLGVTRRLELISFLLGARYGVPLRGAESEASSHQGPSRTSVLSQPDECPHCTSKTGPFRDLKSAWLCHACARTFTTPEVAAV